MGYKKGGGGGCKKSNTGEKFRRINIFLADNQIPGLGNWINKAVCVFPKSSSVYFLFSKNLIAILNSRYLRECVNLKTNFIGHVP